MKSVYFINFEIKTGNNNNITLTGTFIFLLFHKNLIVFVMATLKNEAQKTRIFL